MNHYTAIFSAVTHHVIDVTAPDYDSAMDAAMDTIDDLKDFGLFRDEDEVNVELLEDDDRRLQLVVQDDSRAGARE